MKRIALIFGLLLGVCSSYAQVVFYGTQEFDKVKKEGLYTYISIDKKYIEKGWRLKLAEFGKPVVSKENYNVAPASMPKISENPVNLSSKVTSAKGKVTVFMSVMLQDSLFVNDKHPKYAEAEKVLKDFAVLMLWEEEVRKVEDAHAETVKRQEKTIRQGERLVDGLESNKKDKDKLLKKIDENKAEYDKLLADQEANKKEQVAGSEELEKTKAASPTEKELAAAKKKYDKIVNQGERISKNIDSNIKEKERLPRKLEENKLEFDKYNLDIEQNKKDQIRMADEVAKSQKALNEVKGRKPLN